MLEMTPEEIASIEEFEELVRESISTCPGGWLATTPELAHAMAEENGRLEAKRAAKQKQRA